MLDADDEAGTRTFAVCSFAFDCAAAAKRTSSRYASPITAILYGIHTYKLNTYLASRCRQSHLTYLWSVTAKVHNVLLLSVWRCVEILCL